MKHDQIVLERNADKYPENVVIRDKLFKISDLRMDETKFKFSGSIMTGGVAVSVIFNLINPKDVVEFSRNSNQPQFRRF